MGRSGPTVIVGTIGMLGRALADIFPRCMPVVEIPGPEDLDVTDAAAVETRLESLQPSVVINATGYTDVDEAEREPEAADLVNRQGPANLAAACEMVDALLVHYSTDYVFDGTLDRPYQPDDRPHPINAYGRSKLAGEQAVRNAGGQWLIIRSSWMFAPHGRNFVRTILEHARRAESLSVVDDQRGTPTYAPDLAAASLELVDAGARGILHVANAGECTWFELAGAAVECAGLECRILPCRTADQTRPAPRPAYSVLDCELANGLIGPQRPWRDALTACVSAITVPEVTP
ncbi:MAG: dTDP-4-dehydrorhamnose reductase [Planctomycetota bacterium]|jgi:dTDP-4-dehydrorhamnose reductase